MRADSALRTTAAAAASRACAISRSGAPCNASSMSPLSCGSPYACHHRSPGQAVAGAEKEFAVPSCSTFLMDGGGSLRGIGAHPAFAKRTAASNALTTPVRPLGRGALVSCIAVISISVLFGTVYLNPSACQHYVRPTDATMSGRFMQVHFPNFLTGARHRVNCTRRYFIGILLQVIEATYT